jgi:hypothetical protein
MRHRGSADVRPQITVEARRRPERDRAEPAKTIAAALLG